MYSMVTSIVRQLVFLIPIAYVLARYGASVGNSDLVWWCYPHGGDILPDADAGVFLPPSVQDHHRPSAGGTRVRKAERNPAALRLSG